MKLAMCLLCVACMAFAEDLAWSESSPTALVPAWPKSSPAALVLEGGCKKHECFITINGRNGEEIVRISEWTGKVTVAHPERSDEAARQFWAAMESVGLAHLCQSTRK